MAKFLFIYRKSSESNANISPDEMQKIHQKWQNWMAEGLQKGWLIDAGNALKAEGRVVNAKKVVSDGPFIEAKEIVGGFSIIEADALDTAAELAKGSPILLSGGTVEVRPFWDIAPSK